MVVIQDLSYGCYCFFFSSRRRHTRFDCDWSSDVCSSDLIIAVTGTAPLSPEGKTVAKGDAAGQARRCLEIVQSAIEELGGKLSDVTRTRILQIGRASCRERG